MREGGSVDQVSVMSVRRGDADVGCLRKFTCLRNDLCSRKEKCPSSM